MLRLKLIMTKVLEIICVAMFVFITVVGTYQIVTRYVFNSPSTVSEELLTYSFTWLAVLAAALVFGKREHMRMGFFADKLSPAGLKIVYVISELLVILFAALVMIYGGVSITKLTMTQVTASLGLPMAAIYVITPICGVFTVIFSIINIYEIIKERDIKPLSRTEEDETISERAEKNGRIAAESDKKVIGGDL